MKLLISISLVIIVHVTIITATQIEPPKCCENDKNILLETKCDVNSEGKHQALNLECPEKYILDPTLFEDDAFTVTENGTLSIPEMDTVLFANEFCITNLYVKETNETKEIAIVCYTEESEILSISETLKAAFLIISIVFLLLTLYIYYLLPELRETQDKVMICTLICLTGFMSFLTCLQLYVPEELEINLCLIFAIPTFFFTIAYFSWLNCVIINVWKIIVLKKWKINESLWYKLNHLYGWSIPIILTIILYVKHFFKPSLGVNSCWFHLNYDQWQHVYIPIIIMLSINVIFCIWSSICLTTNEYTPDTLKALRYKCILYLKIFLLGGFTWIFEVVSYTFNNHAPSAWIWIIVDSINLLHGVLVFCVLILWRQRIRKELANRKILCFTCPSKWADIDDEEQVCLENEGNRPSDVTILSP